MKGETFWSILRWMEKVVFFRCLWALRARRFWDACSQNVACKFWDPASGPEIENKRNCQKITSNEKETILVRKQTFTKFFKKKITSNEKETIFVCEQNKLSRFFFQILLFSVLKLKTSFLFLHLFLTVFFEVCVVCFLCLVKGRGFHTLHTEQLAFNATWAAFFWSFAECPDCFFSFACFSAAFCCDWIFWCPRAIWQFVYLLTEIDETIQAHASEITFYLPNKKARKRSRIFTTIALFLK